MYITIITDCTDANVQGRLGTRVASLFNISPTFVGVGANLQHDNSVDPAEYEAAGCLVDVLDAAENGKGVILVNVANRHAKGKKWPNGTPFAFVTINNSLIVSTIDGVTLSLLKKLDITDHINVTDIPSVVAVLNQKGVINEHLKEHITHTQFRSFEYEPRLAKWLTDGIHIPNSKYAFTEVEDIPLSVWYVDNFGNCKTTILPEEIGFKPGTQIETKLGTFTCYRRLKDVPNGENALIIGSSGFQDKRFIELVVQGKSAAELYKLTPGSKIL